VSPFLFCFLLSKITHNEWTLDKLGRQRNESIKLKRIYVALAIAVFWAKVGLLQQAVGMHHAYSNSQSSPHPFAAQIMQKPQNGACHILALRPCSCCRHQHDHARKIMLAPREVQAQAAECQPRVDVRQNSGSSGSGRRHENLHNGHAHNRNQSELKGARAQTRHFAKHKHVFTCNFNGVHGMSRRRASYANTSLCGAARWKQQQPAHLLHAQHLPLRNMAFLHKRLKEKLEHVAAAQA
jgi:hypothetical protein